MSKNLLVESMTFKADNKRIVESNDGSGKRFMVTGLLQRVGEKNKNGRIYPKKVLQREVSRYTGEEIAEDRAFGELDHPESSVVEMKNVSHIIRDVNWKGNELYGEVQVLDTPAGRILKEMFDVGATLGISSRGLGSVEENRGDDSLIVQDDYRLIAWDFVADPSTEGAFMTVNEAVDHGANYSYNDSEIHKVLREIVCDLSGVCELK